MKKLAPVLFVILMLVGCGANKGGVTGEATVAAATATPSPTTPATATLPITLEPCGRLDPLLRELSQSDDPLSLAGVNNLMLTPDGLLVRLTLTHPNADLSAYTLTLKGQQDTLWDAYVPLAQLCPLADEPVVVSVEAIRGDVQE